MCNYTEDVFTTLFAENISSTLEPLLPPFGRLNNKDTAAGAPSVQDIDDFIRLALQSNDDLDAILIDAIHASGSLLLLSTHLRAAMVLMRNPDLYSQKCSSRDQSHVPFFNTQSIADMRQWLTVNALPLSSTRIRPTNLLQQLQMASTRTKRRSSNRQPRANPSYSEKVAIFFDVPTVPPGTGYVAVTRVKKLSDLFL